MEAEGIVRAGSPASDVSRAKTLREPLFWAAAAAFAGTALGLLGNLWQFGIGDSPHVSPASILVSQTAQLLGGMLVLSSSLGAVYLFWRLLRRRRAVLFGLAALAIALAASAVGIASVVYWNTGGRIRGFAEPLFSGLAAASFYAVVLLPPVALLLFAVGGLTARERTLGTLLAGLFLMTIPYGWLWFTLFPPDLGTFEEPGPLARVLFVLLGSSPAGALQAPLWVALGVFLLRRARSQASGEAFRLRERENLKTARRLYEEGLGRGDVSVLDDLVSEDFRDLKRGSRGKLAMERVFSALWKSYPDLTVSVEAQEAEGDLVRTRLVLSGTDRGGVLWYPPTGKRATFTVLFVDRFSDERLIEHSGEADTETLLRELGLTPGPPPADNRRAEDP